ncbi:hypothetical protein ACHAPT_010142 [Fusarium lateritium]
MAAAATSVTTWPATASALRELLKIDACHSFTCHGHIKQDENKRCSNTISKSDCDNAAKQLDQIVKLGSFKAAQPTLETLSDLIMCKNKRSNHRGKFSPGRLLDWKSKLGSIPSPSVEDEENGSSDDEVDTQLPTTPSSSSQQSSKAKNDASTQQDTIDLTSQTSSLTANSPKKDAGSPKATKESKVVHKFERYSIARSITYINEDIRKLLLRPLLEKEKLVGGYIYTYTFPESYHDASPYLKIGFAQDVRARMACWESKCGYSPKVLVQQSADHYVKIEKLVHKQLLNQRKRETGGCPACGVEHKEWFSASELDASRAVSLWTSWMRQMPYDEEGQLKGKWRARIEGLDMSDPACWEELVNAVYVDDESDVSEEEEDEFQWSTDDESHHSAEEYEIYESEYEYEYDDKDEEE